MTDGKSHPKLVYLAGPIDLVDQETSQNWRTEAAIQLKAQGFGVFSPAHAFELPDAVSTDTATSVLSINRAALEICDAVLANLVGPGYGTPIEFHDMLAARKVGTCFNGNTASLYVTVWPHYATMNNAILALMAKYDG